VVLVTAFNAVKYTDTAVI